MKLNQKSSMREDRMSQPWMNWGDRRSTAPPHRRKTNYTRTQASVAAARYVSLLPSHPQNQEKADSWVGFHGNQLTL